MKTEFDNTVNEALNKTDVSSSDFRIVESYKNEFYIQKLIKETKKTGYLWWKKTEKIERWARVTKLGQELIISMYYSNFEDLLSFTTKQQAVKWIEDFHKYPIYHYC